NVLNPVIAPAALPRLCWWERCLAGWRRWAVHLNLLERRPARRLRLCETVSLGEKRFVAVLRFERHQFLVGGTANSIALLARLGQARCDREDAKERSGC